MLLLHSGFTEQKSVRDIRNAHLNRDSLPIHSAASGKESSLLVDRYSTSTAAKIAFLNEFVHMSFHLQNWFSGIIVASAPVISPQVVRIGRMDSKMAETAFKN